jgi:hypothetical protein
MLKEVKEGDGGCKMNSCYYNASKCFRERGKFEDVKSQILGFGISCIQPRVLGSCKLLLVWIIL